MNRKIVVAMLAGVFFAAGCGGGLKSIVSKGEMVPTFADTKVDKHYLWVRGLAAANPEHTSKMQKRAMSREAAVANAFQRSVEYIKGAGIIANVRVKDAISQDSTIETKVNGVVRGSEIVTTEYTEDDGCTVVLKIPRDKLQQMNVEFPEDSAK